jgi:hypothetical protein
MAHWFPEFPREPLEEEVDEVATGTAAEVLATTTGAALVVSAATLVTGTATTGTTTGAALVVIAAALVTGTATTGTTTEADVAATGAGASEVKGQKMT